MVNDSYFQFDDDNKIKYIFIVLDQLHTKHITFIVNNIRKWNAFWKKVAQLLKG